MKRVPIEPASCVHETLLSDACQECDQYTVVNHGCGMMVFPPPENCMQCGSKIMMHRLIAYKFPLDKMVWCDVASGCPFLAEIQIRDNEQAIRHLCPAHYTRLKEVWRKLMKSLGLR